MNEIIGFQPYRGYFDINKNPLTGQKEEIVTWEKYNDYTRYSTFESAFNDISTAYGGKLDTFKIETIYAPTPSDNIYTIQPIQNNDDNTRIYTTPAVPMPSASAQPSATQGNAGILILGALAWAVFK